MLDWDMLMPAGAGQKISHSGETTGRTDDLPDDSRDVPERRNWDKVSQCVPLKTGSVPPPVGQAKASNGKVFRGFFSSVPVVPPKKQGRGKEEGKNSGGAAAEPHDFRAENQEDFLHSIHPAAVLLVLAWSRHKQITREERACLLLDLETMQPGEQVRYWNQVCMQDGLKSWQILYLPATTSGQDCTLCRNLITRHDTIGHERQQYHWACRQGYLILEHGRGTERIWIAPPECHSFERWYPSDWR